MEKYEGISDNMELEIARFLNLVSDGRLSSESKLKIRDMLRRRYATGIAMDVDLPTADLYTDLTNTSHFATPTG